MRLGLHSLSLSKLGENGQKSVELSGTNSVQATTLLLQPTASGTISMASR